MNFSFHAFTERASGGRCIILTKKTYHPIAIRRMKLLRWDISSKTLRRFTSNAEAFWFKQLIVFGKELILSNRMENRGQDGETVKGDFFTSFHIGMLIDNHLLTGDASESRNL